MSESTTIWYENALGLIEAAWLGTIALAPTLILALFVLLFGWFLARITRVGVRRAANAANGLLDQSFRQGPLAGARLSRRASVILGDLAFWIVILLAFTIAARLLGFTMVASWLNGITVYLPSLLTGAAIIFLGYVFSQIAGEQFAETARTARIAHSALLGRLSQIGIFVTGLVIGLDQIGVDVTFLVALFAVVVGSAFGALALAFGLGARNHVRNLVGARTAKRELSLGQRLRIGDIEGDLLEITGTHLALDTEQGRTLVPSAMIDHTVVVLWTTDTELGSEDD